MQTCLSRLVIISRNILPTITTYCTMARAESHEFVVPASATLNKENTIALFDVDGTLTPHRGRILPDMEEFMEKLRGKVTVGIVGGSDLTKIAEQISALKPTFSDPEEQVINDYEWVFCENGLVAYKDAKKIGSQSLLKHMGEERTQKVINWCMDYMSKQTLPMKRGNFIEFRTGMINVCPVGRTVSYDERQTFSKLDIKEGIRKKFVQDLHDTFNPEYDLHFVTGGQISIDIFPKGWDKTFCLQFIEKKFEHIFFFGDRTGPGGNDKELYEHPRTMGYNVKNPQDTKEKVSKIFFPDE